MSDKFIATICEFRIAEDDWNEGEGDIIDTWSEAVSASNSIQGVLDNVPYRNLDSRKTEELFENDPIKEHDYSRFDADITVDYVNGMISKPTPEKNEKFRKAEVKLYALHITVYIKKVSDLTMTDVGPFLA